VQKQYQLAQSYGFPFIHTASEVQRNVNSEALVRVAADRYLELHAVSYPYAVSETKLFLGRLSTQYYAACGEKLTVTSLLRPSSLQPANSVALSVHPTGMAVDLRIPLNRSCRSWLERTLLSLEKERVLDVTRERHPPHYHVAVYAEQYETRVAAMAGATSAPAVTALAPPAEREVAVATTAATASRYVVRKGDSLWDIAARSGVSVAELRVANSLPGNRITAGQTLQIPATDGTASATLVAGNEIAHRVHRGDTLWTIANRYGTSVKKLRQANNTGNFIKVGQVLRISRG
jgi:LysM repeat protein